MEKISGIIPANARVTTVDLKNSGVARSGSPSFGREVGVSSVIARSNELDLSAKANLIQADQISLRSSKRDPRAEIVQRMTDNFFMKKAKQYEEIANNEDNLIENSTTDLTLNSDLDSDESASEDSPVAGQHLDIIV